MRRLKLWRATKSSPGVIVAYGPEGQVAGVELMDAQRAGPWPYVVV